MARSRIKYSQVKELEKILRDSNYYDDILSTIGDLASLTGWLQELLRRELLVLVRTAALAATGIIVDTGLGIAAAITGFYNDKWYNCSFKGNGIKYSKRY